MDQRQLLVDLYELTMAQAYWREGHTGTASFSLFIRGYPAKRRYYVANGVDASLDFLQGFAFSQSDIEALRTLERFDEEFLDYLSNLRFTGDVRAVSDGTVVFADEPIMEVDAPIIEGQLLETALLNLVTTHTNLTTKAARVVEAADGHPVVDFAARRTHGPDAAFIAARSSWVAGFAGTSHVGAASALGIPAVGTMAHSFIQSYELEIDAFRAYASTFPDSTVLLVDTWDIEAGIENAIVVGKEMEDEGHHLAAIRIDSGDLAEGARMARRMLDEAGLGAVKITVSGGLDEYKIAGLIAEETPIDSFGVGSAFGVSADAPYIDTVYKLVAYEGQPVHKASPGKRTLPGQKQVWRTYSADGSFAHDAISYMDDAPVESAFPLLSQAMTSGVRTDGRSNSVTASRERCRVEIGRLPTRLRSIEASEHYDVRVTGRLEAEAST